MMVFKASAVVVLIAVWSFTASVTNAESTDPTAPANAQSADPLAASEIKLCRNECATLYDEACGTCFRDVCKSDNMYFHPSPDDDGNTNTPQPAYTPCEKDCIKKASDAQTKCDQDCIPPPR